MIGDMVILRVFGGGAALGRIVTSDQDTVIILAPDEFALYLDGINTLIPIGFPWRDVFRYAPELGEIVGQEIVDWEGMTPYIPNTASISPT